MFGGLLPKQWDVGNHQLCHETSSWKMSALLRGRSPETSNVALRKVGKQTNNSLNPRIFRFAKQNVATASKLENKFNRKPQKLFLFQR